MLLTTRSSLAETKWRHKGCISLRPENARNRRLRWSRCQTFSHTFESLLDQFGRTPPPFSRNPTSVCDCVCTTPERIAPAFRELVFSCDSASYSDFHGDRRFVNKARSFQGEIFEYGKPCNFSRYHFPNIVSFRVMFSRVLDDNWIWYFEN